MQNNISDNGEIRTLVSRLGWYIWANNPVPKLDKVALLDVMAAHIAMVASLEFSVNDKSQSCHRQLKQDD
jgi:hypothetical protein